MVCRKPGLLRANRSPSTWLSATGQITRPSSRHSSAGSTGSLPLGQRVCVRFDRSPHSLIVEPHLIGRRPGLRKRSVSTGTKISSDMPLSRI